MASVVINGDTSGAVTITAPAVAGTPTLTLPTTTDTLIGRATTDTLTNKSIVASQLTGTQTIPRGTLPTGSVLQVVSTTLTTGFSTSVNNSYSAVTGLTAVITPSSSSSKIMVFVTMTIGSDTNYLNAKLTSGGTAISGALATTAGSRTVGTASFWPVQTYGTYGLAFNYLDSPATTSATTYGVQIGSAGAVTLCVNQSQADDNSSGRTRGTSTITVMEIAA